MHSAKECTQAPGQEGVHEKEAALILNERQVQLRSRNDSAPRMFLHIIERERAHFRPAEKSHRGAEQNARGTETYQK